MVNSTEQIISNLDFSMAAGAPKYAPRQAVWMDKSARRGAKLKLTRRLMREGFSLNSAPPLTEEDKTLLRNCLNSNQNVNQVLRDIVKKNNTAGRGMRN